MKKYLPLLLLASLALKAEDILIAAWDFSNVSGSFAGNTIKANVSDLYAGDGEAIDGASGTLFADGSFGSSFIDNSDAFSLLSGQGNIPFNQNVVTPTRPDLVDLRQIDGVPIALQLADGSFGVGGPADASQKNIVFVASAPSGFRFAQGTYQFSYALSRDRSVGTVVTLETSLNGIDFVAAGSDTITSPEQLGSVVSLSTTGTETNLYVRLGLPDLGFGNIEIDNVQIVGPAPVDANTSTWAGYTVDENGFADTQGRLGFINVSLAPWYYNFNLNTFMFIPSEPAPGAGFWTYIIKNGTTANTGTFWGGYAEDPSGNAWVNADNWIGFFNVSVAPYIYVIGNVMDRGFINTFIYAPEPTAGFTGHWVYVFPPLPTR